MKNELKFRLISSEGELVSFEDFARLCSGVIDTLKGMESAVVGSTRHIRYKITGLEMGSACLNITPVPTDRGKTSECREVTRLFRSTLRAIKKGHEVDARLGLDNLRSIEKMIKPLRNRSQEIWASNIKITKKFNTNLKQLIETEWPCIGEVRGYVERLDVHGKSKFDLFPALGGKIVCTFEDDLFEDVRAAIKRHIVVEGMMHCRRDSAMPFRVEVKKITLLRREDELPTLRSLKGMAPKCTGNVESTAFVRALRDEQD